MSEEEFLLESMEEGKRNRKKKRISKNKKQK